MLNGKKIVVVMPAYNAEKTLLTTYKELDRQIVDEVILVDDCSKDRTKDVAESLPIAVIRHEKNKGYGGNQKTCYKEALNRGADVVVMLHPDYQYSPKLVPAMASMIAYGEYDCIMGSRIIGGRALSGGMPIWKYISNRILTLLQNWCTGSKLSEYHTGFRAFKKEILTQLPLNKCNDGFVFDSEMISQVIYANYRIGELSCPTRYFEEASSIKLWPSIVYGVGVLRTSFLLLLARKGLYTTSLFKNIQKQRPIEFNPTFE